MSALGLPWSRNWHRDTRRPRPVVQLSGRPGAFSLPILSHTPRLCCLSLSQSDALHVADHWAAPRIAGPLANPIVGTSSTLACFKGRSSDMRSLLATCACVRPKRRLICAGPSERPADADCHRFLRRRRQLTSAIACLLACLLPHALPFSGRTACNHLPHRTLLHTSGPIASLRRGKDQ